MCSLPTKKIITKLCDTAAPAAFEFFKKDVVIVDILCRHDALLTVYAQICGGSGYI